MKSHKIINICLLMLAAAAFSSCRHKDFIEDCGRTGKLRVVFDWRKAPEADPSSMEVYFFNKEGGAPLRYMFDNKYGGEITLPYGSYDAICLNSDNTDWATLRNTNDIDEFEILTTELTHISLQSIRTTTESPLNDRTLRDTPRNLWTDRGDSFTHQPTDGDRTVTFYPEDPLCYYTVDIYDVENLDASAERSFFSTITSMAESWRPGSKRQSNETVTMPFTLKASEDNSHLHGEFMNFGQAPDIIYTNTLKVYTFNDDGTASAYPFDVTDQIHKAPDPHHVHIVLRGLPLPEPLISPGGLRPSVDDWKEQHISLEM